MDRPTKKEKPVKAEKSANCASAKNTTTYQSNLEKSSNSTEAANKGSLYFSAYRSERCSALQKKLCGINFKEVWRMTENLALKNGDGGFEPERMLRYARSGLKTEDLLDECLILLLDMYVKKGMSEDSAAKQIQHLPDPQQRYCYEIFWAADDDKEEEDGEALNFTRLAMTFPYEVAFMRSCLIGKTKSSQANLVILPGKVGDLPPVLAFPYAGLIIPTKGWEKIARDWERWYVSFLELKIGIRLPAILHVRLTEQIRRMRALAAEDDAGNVIMMTTLGLSLPS